MTDHPSLRVIAMRGAGYDAVYRRQLELRERCIESGGLENYLMVVEHLPVITVGRRGRMEDVLLSRERLAEKGIELVETNRGGMVTFHGPGQLVLYPIIDLKRRGRDLHRYLRELESWLVNVCIEYGVAAHTAPPHTGVWVENRKIASIGIAVRRWVAYHGVALNVSTDLSYFDMIVPCGLREAQMTSLQQECGLSLTCEEVAERAVPGFRNAFGFLS